MNQYIFECSELYRDGCEAKYKGMFDSSSKSSQPSQKPQQQSKNQKQQSLSLSFVTKTVSKTVETTKQPIVKGNRTVRKYGRRKVSGAELQRENSGWYLACEK